MVESEEVGVSLRDKYIRKSFSLCVMFQLKMNGSVLVSRPTSYSWQARRNLELTASQRSTNKHCLSRSLSTFSSLTDKQQRHLPFTHHLEESIQA